MKVEQQEVPT